MAPATTKHEDNALVLCQVLASIDNLSINCKKLAPILGCHQASVQVTYLHPDVPNLHNQLIFVHSSRKINNAAKTYGYTLSKGRLTLKTGNRKHATGAGTHANDADDDDDDENDGHNSDLSQPTVSNARKRKHAPASFAKKGSANAAKKRNMGVPSDHDDDSAEEQDDEVGEEA